MNSGSQTIHREGNPQSQECDAVAPLQAIKDRIAALRITAEALGSTSEASTDGLPMVPVFGDIGQYVESLTSDRDVTKRNERIVTELNKRGRMRLLGAVASPALAEAITSLHETHPNFGPAVDYLLGEEILARQTGSAISGIRLLLHGSPGNGKTDFSFQVAKILGVPIHVIGISSSQAGAFLAGSEEYWSNSQPGQVWKMIIQGAYANGLCILDEVDKASKQHGDPLGALFQLLEPLSAACFCDKSVPWLPIDASRINWIATANHPEQLHPAIRSRFVEIEVDAPPVEARKLLIQRLYQELLTECGLSGRFPDQLSVEHVSAMARLSVRDIKSVLRSSIALALRQGASELTRIEIGRRMSDSQRIGFI